LREDAVLDVVVDKLLDAYSGELMSFAFSFSSLHSGSNAVFQLARNTTGERRKDSVDAGVREFRFPEHSSQLLEGRGHDGLVVEPVEDIVQGFEALTELLVRLVACDGGRSHGREEAFERFGVFDAAGVVEGQDTENVTRLEADSRLLDELDNTILGGDERHIHFHDLENIG
jgi:hypothetical protein